MIARAGFDAGAVVTRVFGDVVPADSKHALAQLEQSPLKPQDPAELQAVRAVVLERATAALEELKQLDYKPAFLQPQAGDARPMPAAMALRLQEMTKPLDPVISVERAREVFDKLASDPDIPHRFVHDGCHFRAHVEAKALEDEGVYSEKVFLRPDSGADLRIDSEHAQLGWTLGIFHTAPVVLVKDADGEVSRRVLDPSLGSEPMTLDAWRSRMRAMDGGSCETFFLPRQALHLSDRYDPPTSWREEDVKDAVAWNHQYKEVQAELEKMGFDGHLQELAKMYERGPGA
jgi:hypothetical protein